jgi:transcriptional regulator with XRE-family HTH domain
MARGKGTGVTPKRVQELIAEAVAKESQYAVAKKSGLALSMVQGLLRGDREPTTSTLNRLSEYFGVPVWELRGDREIVWWDRLKDKIGTDEQKFLMEMYLATCDSDAGQIYYDCFMLIKNMPDPTCLLKAQKILHMIIDDYVPSPPEPKMDLKEKLRQMAERSAIKKNDP